MNEQVFEEEGVKYITTKPLPRTDALHFWSCAVCVGTVIIFVAGIGHMNSLGLIYKEFMVKTNSTSKSLTAAYSVFAIMLAIGGFILNIVTNKYTIQVGGYVGSFLFIAGSIATVFISNVNQLVITMGVLQGIGFGMMVPVCYATMNFYFVKKRTSMLSFCKSVQGIIQIFYPQVLSKLMLTHGFQKTLLALSAISLTTGIGMALMKNTNTTNTSIIAKNQTCKAEREHVELMNRKVEEKIKENREVNTKSQKKIFWAKILKVLNVKFLKDPVLVNVCIGIGFVMFSDLTFFMLQPMLLFQYGYEMSKVATFISIGAGADVSGRIILALTTYFCKVDTRVIFYISTWFTLIFRVVLLQVNQFMWVALATAALGILRAWLHVTSPLIIANHVSHEDFPAAYAVYVLLAGFINVVCGPIVGFLKDLYGSYEPSFYGLLICCIPCLLLWPLEYVYLSKINKNSR